MKLSRYHVMGCWIGVMCLSMNGLNLEAAPSAYRVVAAKHAIPSDILFSIALTESGYRYGTKTLPWPWTLNVNGQGAYFRSRDDATVALKKAIRQTDSVDIGLMQINWRWHKARFPSLEAALDPYSNLQVGANILLEQYQRSQDWWVAVGQYHAPASDTVSQARATEYCKRVYRYWHRETVKKNQTSEGQGNDQNVCR